MNKKMKKLFDNDNYQSGLRVVIICTLAVILMVGVNLLSGVIPTKVGNIDVSTAKKYSVSKETQEEMSAIEKPVTIYYVCEAGDEYHNTEVVLNLYADASKNITVEKIDPAYNPTLVAQYSGDAALANNSLIVISGDRREIVNFSDYYTSGSFVLEDFLNSAIRYVTSDELKVAYELQGHDEPSIHSSTAAYMGLDGFKLEKLDLMKEETIPSDASLVIINGIKKDITSKEGSCLINYFKQGGSLLLVTDYTTAELKNLDAVTEYFGASSGSGIIMESDSSRYTDENPAYIFPNILSGDYTVTKGISYIMMPNSKPIVIDENADASIKATSLLEASESAYAVYTNIFTNETITEEGPLTIGASFEKGQNGQEGKMIWVTSKYISDVTVSSSVGGGNITFFLNSVCWLGQDEAVESIHGKTIESQYLTFTDKQLNMWSIIIIGVIPAIILILGIVICIRRRRR